MNEIEKTHRMHQYDRDIERMAQQIETLEDRLAATKVKRLLLAVEEVDQ